MRIISKITCCFILSLTGVAAFSQQKKDSLNPKQLDEVVITGQYQPQSVKNSVYQVRVVNRQRIQLSGATTVQQVLNNQLGFRFSNDNTLGTTDVQLMGMNGRNVKILLDGVPMTDRGDTRESLNQIDVNTIERIEIVEGPMSVSYGSDALAGVINIITKKTAPNSFAVFAKAQEESAGSEYYPFSFQGVHMQNLGLSVAKKGWNASLGGTHNDFDGLGGDSYGRAKTWKPKEQWFGNAKLGYSNAAFNIYYRLDALKEDIISRNAINYNTYKAIDQRYESNRYTHQLQSQYRVGNKFQWTGIAAYTNYERSTKTTRHDFEKNTDELTTGSGEQDLSTLKSFMFRTTGNVNFNKAVSLQAGIDINHEKAGGQRIAGTPHINDYALFVSSEIKPTAKINIRPGLRFIKNSVYDAPPVIPSVNAKFALGKTTDLRVAYAYGFRAPALRELYFSFVDANHNIVGNPDLEAEHSNSFNASFAWTPIHKTDLVYTGTLTGFFNEFSNQIDFAVSGTNSSIYTYFNINHSKTTGATLDNKVSYKKLDASLGFSYIAYSFGYDPAYIKEDGRDLLWTPEINSNITYDINKIKTKVSLFYKFSGEKPAFTTALVNNKDAYIVTRTSSYSLADLTVNTVVNKFLSVNLGVKNLFDVTNVKNTNVSGSVHSPGANSSVAYGRSYFAGIAVQFNKK